MHSNNPVYNIYEITTEKRVIIKTNGETNLMQTQNSIYSTSKSKKYIGTSLLGYFCDLNFYVLITEVSIQGSFNTLQYYTGTQNGIQWCNGVLYNYRDFRKLEICNRVSIVYLCTHLKFIVLFSLPLIQLPQTITFYSEFTQFCFFTAELFL